MSASSTSPSSFFISKEEATKEREARNERKKESQVSQGGERSSMHKWMMHTMQQQQQNNNNNNSMLGQLKSAFGFLSSGPSAKPKSFTPEEIAQHNTKDDSWMVIHNIVYDVTKFIPFHPGGLSIMHQYSGKDVSELYDVFHPWVNCEAMMASCVIGVLDRSGGSGSGSGSGQKQQQEEAEETRGQMEEVE